jgi:MoaA/NifB/PqqE/SkfB family radical SAM enzyme
MKNRHMVHEFEGVRFYESSFNTETGLLVRVTEDGTHENNFGWDANMFSGSPDSHERLKRFRDMHSSSTHTSCVVGRRTRAYSPVPEVIDVKITDKCGFGCDYCYMGSLISGSHCEPGLLEAIFDGLSIAPYQIAIGGGEPTLHPDLPAFLEFIASRGTIPSYTTAGHKLSGDIVDATVKHSGGVALTYHPHKGLPWFAKTFLAWKEAVGSHVQLNTHVIAKRGVSEDLLGLTDVFENTKGLAPQDLRVVLLAYRPDVGRGHSGGLMRVREVNADLPDAINRVSDAGVTISFSEGLLPYFNSRQDIIPSVTTTFTVPMEGTFSCYIDMVGSVSKSSFDTPRNPSRTVFTEPTERIWHSPNWHDENYLHGAACGCCKYKKKCASPHNSLLLTCAYTSLNRRFGKENL